MSDIDIKIKETEEEYELIRKKLNEVGRELRDLRDQKEEEYKTEAEKALDMEIILAQKPFVSLDDFGRPAIFINFKGV